MKEKRAPSRPLSLWVYPALLMIVLVSCFLMSLTSLFNPWTKVTYFSAAVRDTTDGQLYFRTYGIANVIGVYGLDEDGHITCRWRFHAEELLPDITEPTFASLTETQRAVYEERYGTITNASVIDPDLISLVVVDDSVFYGKPFGTRLILIDSQAPDTPTIIDARKLFFADLACDGMWKDGMIGGTLLALSIALSIMGIWRLRHRHVWLLVYVGVLCVGLFIGYFMSHPDV